MIKICIFITSADYQLNGIGEGPISVNLTLAGLSIGEHEIKVVVWTVNGVFSQTLYFSVSQPEPFPVMLVVAASVATVSVVGAAGLLIYHKRKTKTV